MATVLKYIINVNNLPVLFSRDILHNTIAQEVLSAGFLVIRYDANSTRFVVKCFGESTTLHIKSNPNVVNELIEDFLNSKKNEFHIIKNNYENLKIE